jgi:hypothetical protein
LETDRHRSRCDEHKRRGEPVCFALCHGGWGCERRVRCGRPSRAGRYDEGEECKDARGDFLHKQPIITRRSYRLRLKYARGSRWESGATAVR